jgi:hypothetical protein
MKQNKQQQCHTKL